MNGHSFHEERSACIRPEIQITNGDCRRSRKNWEWTRKCIVILLLHAIFLLVVFLVFIIGHYASKNQVENEEILRVIHLVTRDNSTTTSKPPPTLLTTPRPKTPEPMERLIPLDKRKNYTLTDVNPPIGDVFRLAENMHSKRNEKLEIDALLVPLPLYILPYHYDLQLDLSKFDSDLLVKGNVTIHLESYGNTTDNEIHFHLDRRLHPRLFKREETKKLGRIVLKEALKKGKYTLEMQFNVTICDEKNDGVRCSIDKETSLKATSFTTNLQPTLARAFFPCWDEPGIKATFNISTIHQDRYTVLSNMPILKETAKRVGKGKVRTTFQKTPLMSTYLVAIAIGDFSRQDSRTERGTRISIWSYPEETSLQKFVLETAPSIFDRLEDMFEVPYGLPKMDMIAARNFKVGGMENWGLIVFDNSLIAYESPEQESSSANETVDRIHEEYKITKLVTHEVSHQWFGNLVTMRDWADLWLNEGFANFVVHETMTSSHAHIANFDYYDSVYKLYQAQSESESHLALVYEVNRESEVQEAFHPINLYTKGCVLVKMMKDLVSDFAFKDAMKRYLRKYAFRSVTKDELFSSLPAYADHGVEQERLSDVMDTWLSNEGLPEVFVQRNYENDMITLSQRKCTAHNHRSFLHKTTESRPVRDIALVSKTTVQRKIRETDGSVPFDEALFENYTTTRKPKIRQRHRNSRKKQARRYPSLSEVPLNVRREELRKPRRVQSPSDAWKIPVSYMFGSVKTASGQVHREFWLKNKTFSFVDDEISPTQPLILNPDFKYPIRVNYDLHNWKLIARMLHRDHEEIAVTARMQLIMDAQLFLANSDSPHLYLYFLAYLAHETKLEVMLFGIDALHKFVDEFKACSATKSLLSYVKPVVDRMDQLLVSSQSDSQKAALWLVTPNRLSKLYQLRCATGLNSCNQLHHAKSYIKDPDGYSEDVHKQVTAICHYLFTNPNETLLNNLLYARLDQKGSRWTQTVQLASCSRNQKVLRKAANVVMKTRNVAVYASCLTSDYSVHYNPEFREFVWSEMKNLSKPEIDLLFSVTKDEMLPASRVLLHSVRTVKELRQVHSLSTSWSPIARLHFEYLERLLQWIDNNSNGVFKSFFSSVPAVL